MTAAVKPEGGAQQPLRVDVTLDEMEAGLKQQETDAEAKKKADEAAAAAAAAQAPADPRVKALEEALRISEESRRRVAEMQATITTAAAPAAPAAPAELTREQLNELYKNDPIAAIEYLQTRQTRIVEENITKRLSPLVAGNTTTAREQARLRYPDEFKLFETEMGAIVDSLPDKSAMSSLKSWDDLIAWVRGKPDNFEKLVALRDEQNRARAVDDARAAQIAAAGPSVRPEIRSPATKPGTTLDATELEIIKTLGMTQEDYIKWRGVAQ